MKIGFFERGGLMILMAKYIKRRSKELRGGIHQIAIDFIFQTIDNVPCILIDRENYSLKDRDCTYQDLSSLLTAALKETCCKGRIISHPNGCRVLLYGRPIKEFEMLCRLIQKYAKVSIEWDDVRNEIFRDCHMIESDTQYLCYNKGKCDEYIGFLRKKRNSKDSVIISIERISPYFTLSTLLGGDNELPLISQARKGDYAITHFIRISILTPNGKVKHEINATAV